MSELVAKIKRIISIFKSPPKKQDHQPKPRAIYQDRVGNHLNIDKYVDNYTPIKRKKK